MLTHKQNDLLRYIDKYNREHRGVSPSYEEMRDAMNLKSKSGIFRLIQSLEERGFLERLKYRARAIRIVQLPDISSKALPPSQGAAPAEAANVLHEIVESIQLPLRGQIAAGTPIEALQNESDSIEVPATMLGGGEHYALKIEGDSMIEAGIMDGDTVILNRCNTAENGAIVVALIDDEEATLKRYRKNKSSVALEPANKNYGIQIYGPARIAIQGKLVGLLRQY